MPVGELYSDPENPKSVLGQPPAPPTDVPAPTAPVKVEQPVAVHERRMADQDAAGNVRDTSMDAITKPGHDLNFRNVDDEALVAKQTPPTPDKPSADAKPPEPPKETPPVAAPPPEPKLFAGKFKTVEDMEAAYKEVESAKSRAFQEKAALERQIQANAAAPPPAPPKSPELLAAERAENDRIINNLVADPKAFVQREIIDKVTIALTAQQRTEQWRRDNPDLAKDEIRVAFEATLLAQSDPELARNPEALLAKATEQYRSMVGRIRTEGAREALTMETRVIPLVTNTAPAPAPEQPPQKAPLTSDEAFDNHIRMLKAEEQRSHRGLRR